LNIIEYIFCERLFVQVLLIEKSAAEKVRQEKCDRKSVVEKSRQENCDRKSAAGKVW
jgi:hypothetical protein